MPSVRRQVAVAICLVLLGVALQGSFDATYEHGLGDQRAVELHPENASQVADHVSRVADLDERYGRLNTQAKVAVDTAARDGRYHTSDASASLYDLVDTIEDRPYAVYRGDYYRVNASVEQVSEADESATLELTQSSADAVLSDLAVPYARADADARAIVDGRDPPDGMTTDTVVRKNGTYYGIVFEDPSEAVGRLLLAPVVILLSRAGSAYIAIGLGVLALLGATRTPQPLTRRHLGFVLAATVPVTWVAAIGLLPQQPVAVSLRPLELLPATGMLAAGHFAARREWLPVGIGAAATIPVALIAGAMSYGVIGVLVAIPASFFLGLLALPIAWFGATLTPE